MKDFKKDSAEKLSKTLPNSLKGMENTPTKSAGELLSLLLAEAQKARKKGELSDGEIDEFYQKISPMINPIERQTLKKFLKDLKEISPEG